MKTRNLNSYKTNILNVNDGVIEYCSFGKGHPLILVTGYANTITVWDKRLLVELTKSHRVIVFNNRNTGNSIFKTDSYTLTNLANDIEKLRSGLKLDKIDLLGFSMGGAITQKYAYDYSNNINKLILINTAPPGKLLHSPKEKVKDTLKNLATWSLKSYWNIFNLLFSKPWYWIIWWFFHFKPYGSKNIVSKETMRNQQNVAEEWNSLNEPEKLVNNITTPTLIIVGEKDQIIPPINSKILNQHIKNSELVKFPDCGHSIISESPAKLAEIITKFLNK